MSGGVTSIASMTAQAGQGDALGELLGTLLAPSRAETGCLRDDLHRERDDPDTWVMVEYWSSQAAVDAHFETPHLRAFAHAVKALQSGALTMKMLTPLDRIDG